MPPRLLINLLFGQIVGIVATIEQFLVQAEDRNNKFVQRFLSKQHQRMMALYNRHVVRSSFTTFILRLTCLYSLG